MKPKTKPLRGKALLKAAWNYIAKHPEKWDQSNQCGEPCCIGAHVRRLAGIKNTFYPDAYNSLRQFSGLPGGDAFELWKSEATIRELRAHVVKICGSRGVFPVPKV